MATVPSARTAPSARTVAPYLGSLLVSSLIDGVLRHRLFMDLLQAPPMASGMGAMGLGAVGTLYRLCLGGFWLWFGAWILPGLLRGHTPSRRVLRWFGLLATLQFVVNAVAINLALVFAHVGSYTLLMEGIGLYVVIGLIFVFWYWYFDYPLRGQSLGAEGSTASGIPPGVLFPEEAVEGLAYGTNRWTPGFIDYLFFAMVASNTFGAPEGHGVLGARLKLAHMVHSLCTTAIFIVIVARAINTLI